MSTIDLRSDTVTKPTPAMRDAMARAIVGDDVLGDDPTVKELEDRFAALAGKHAACFVPSGTMANQVAIRAHTQPGDEIIAHEGSHIINYEGGGPAALSGCMVRALQGPRGTFTALQVRDAIRPDNPHFARSRLLVVENTHNRGGGSVWPIEEVRSVTAAAREAGLRCHLDGARLWNACASTRLTIRDYAEHFDTIACCFSKGLGAPAGSITAGDAQTIHHVRRSRKLFGGAMRQSGILAAACIFAIEHNIERLHDDHANAQRFASGLAMIPGLCIADTGGGPRIETNLVLFDLAPSIRCDAATLCAALHERGVWMLPTATRRVRAVTSLEVDAAMIDRALIALAEVARAHG
jgi:threonine aldolase